mgnify:CR=1 FL=1
MTKGKVTTEIVEEKRVEDEILPVPKFEPELKIVKLSENENKVKFLVWFTESLGRFPKLKAHHLHAVQVYFKGLGLNEPQTMDKYDEGLKQFGYNR